jgi:hypothetical protein
VAAPAIEGMAAVTDEMVDLDGRNMMGRVATARNKLEQEFQW